MGFSFLYYLLAIAYTERDFPACPPGHPAIFPPTASALSAAGGVIRRTPLQVTQAGLMLLSFALTGYYDLCRLEEKVRGVHGQGWLGDRYPVV